MVIFVFSFFFCVLVLFVGCLSFFLFAIFFVLFWSFLFFFVVVFFLWFFKFILYIIFFSAFGGSCFRLGGRIGFFFFVLFF